MDASTATATASNLFGNMEQKFDLAALLRNVAAAAAASTTVSSSTTITSSTATSPNSIESSSSTNGPVALSGSPSPPHAELKPIPASSLAPPGVVQRRQLSFSPIQPVYAPSGHGRQILIYDSRSHPGRRREFAYKTRFTNQSGLTTVYYRCMACRALRHRLQRSLPREKLPAVPCIAVKNDLLINDPDFPEASDHFCTPLTINESDQRLRNTFERGHKRARMKMANSTVEETIRKVGKLRAEEAEEASAGDHHSLDLDLWPGGGGDASSSSATGLLLNGTLDGSDCSSDSTVDVLKEESPDKDDLMEEEEAEFCDKDVLDKCMTVKEEPKTAEAEEADGKWAPPLKQPKLEATISAVARAGHNANATPSAHANATPSATTNNGRNGCSSSPATTPRPTRSPTKKLDSLLKLAEMRAAAANGQAAKEEQQEKTTSNNSSSHQPTEKANANGHGHSPHHQPQQQQQRTTPHSQQQQHKQANGTATTMPNPLPIHLNSLLCSAAQFPSINSMQQQSNNNAGGGGGIPASVQSIHAIAARLISRGGGGSAAAASELSKALASMKGNNNNHSNNSMAMAQQQQQQQHQQQKGFVNGGVEKLAASALNLQFPMLNGGGHQQQQQGGGAAPIPPAMGMHIADLLKKYVENNLELAPETAGNARSAGELACALFMAQMVENAELRQEVQKLRCELDSLKALVAAAAVVQNNNSNTNHGNAGSNGHHHHQHHHNNRQQQQQLGKH